MNMAFVEFDYDSQGSNQRFYERAIFFRRSYSALFRCGRSLDRAALTAVSGRAALLLLIGAFLATSAGCASSRGNVQTTALPKQDSPQVSAEGTDGSLSMTIVPSSENASSTVELELTKTPVVNQKSEQFSLRLQYGTIDTRVGEPRLPSHLRIEVYDPSVSGYYLVQFEDVILPEWRTELEAAGAEVMGYVPNNAYLIRIAVTESSKLAEVDHVQWVGIYQPAYRISPQISQSEDEELVFTVMTFPGIDQEQFVFQLQEWED